MDEIHEFFAATQTSVYVVKDEMENGCPIVEKIAEKKISPFPIGGKLKNGSRIGIMLKMGIVLYNPSRREEKPEQVNIARWGGKTSSIVALFLEKDRAIRCLDSKNITMCDPRWKKETLETLEKIGNNHPVFVFSIIDGPNVCYK